MVAAPGAQWLTVSEQPAREREPGLWVCRLQLLAGLDQRLEVVAADELGNEARDALRVHGDGTPPVVRFEDLADGFLHASRVLEVAASSAFSSTCSKTCSSCAGRASGGRFSGG